MVLLCGIPGESPLELIADALDEISHPYVVFNQRFFDHVEINYVVSKGIIEGELVLDKEIYRLEDFIGVYNRMVSYQTIPEFKSLDKNGEAYNHCERLHQHLFNWMDIAPCNVVNRNFYMSSNSSKPYQMMLIAKNGFLVPPTIITNDPDEAIAFKEKHGKVIFKSASGVRSIVNELDERYLVRLEMIKQCPTMFQKKLNGFNVRVHVVDDICFVTKILSESTDYRYAERDDQEVKLEEFKLSPSLEKKCVKLSKELGLTFSGIDLMIDRNGDTYCLEVNPSPGFSYYENNTGQKISHAVAKYLCK
jgi:hypothetical protein